MSRFIIREQKTGVPYRGIAWGEIGVKNPPQSFATKFGASQILLMLQRRTSTPLEVVAVQEQ